MLQNATLLRKSAPWPPNISDEHVSCTASGTQNLSLQILFKCPTPAIVFGNATKPSRFAHFWQGAQSPKKWSEHVVLLTFWLRNVLPATTACTFSTSQLPKVVQTCVFCTCWLRNVLGTTTACTFSTSQLPKVVRTWCVLYILTEPGVFCTYWLRNVLRATTACTFSTSQLLQVIRSWGVWYVFTSNVLRATTACNCLSLIWPAGFAPAALASLLFDPPEPQVVWKTQCFATFLPFRAPGSSFFWDFLFFWSSFFFSSLLFSPLLFSSLLFSSLLWLFPPLLFICPYYCRKFDF